MQNLEVLIPVYDNRQSFYHKAVVRMCRTKKFLYSYNTRVATIRNNTLIVNKRVRKDLLFSQTTMRHIKEFAKQELGLFNLTKQDLIKCMR